MLGFVLKRIALAIITLFILSLIVFFAAQVLPGDPGREVLGPLAAQSAVRALDAQLGTDRPVIDQYGTWLGHVLSGNFGTSTQYQAAIGPILGKAIVNSLKLAALGFVIVVPLGIFGGVVSALRYGTRTDRLISVFGLSATVIPEVVSGIILISVFGLWLNILPVEATGGVGFGGTIYHLILPAIPLVLVLFGYIQQMARAGTIEALNSDYARTATLKGLPRRTLIRRHILRNSLLPTITVIATPDRLSDRRPGAGRGALPLERHRLAALQRRDPQGLLDARSGRDRHRRGLHDRHAAGRHPLLAAQPADSGGGRRMSLTSVPVESAGALNAAQGAPDLRREFLRSLVRQPAFMIGSAIILLLDRLRDLRLGLRRQPLFAEPAVDQQGAFGRTLVRDRPDSGGTCSRASSPAHATS